jgi:flagellar basal body-associated protein FliL
MEPEATQTRPFRSILIFIVIGLVLLVAVILGIRWAKGRSDQLANASKPQTVAQQPQQQPATTNAQPDAQKKAEADKQAAAQKAADDKKKADAAAAADKAKQDQAAKDKAAADKAAADKATADKAAADKASADKAAADKAAAEKNKVATTPTTGPAQQTPKAVPSTGIEDAITPIFGISLLAFLTIRYIDSRRRLNVIS